MNKNFHLIFCAVALVPIAISYGIAPNLSNELTANLYDFKLATTDVKHIFRAIMGLYLGMVGLWTIGIMKPKYWRFATMSAVFFMGGLFLGRLSSILLDGLPSITFIAATVGEILMALWGIYNLKRYPDLESPTTN